MRSHRENVLKKMSLAGAALLLGALVSPSASAVGWTSSGVTPWGATVLSVQTQDGGAANGLTFVWLSSAGATNASNCATYLDSTTGSISGAQLVVVHPINSAMTDVQKSQIAELQVAASSGKQVRLYSVGCSGGGTAGYNVVSGVWVKY